MKQQETTSAAYRISQHVLRVQVCCECAIPDPYQIWVYPPTVICRKCRYVIIKEEQ